MRWVHARTCTCRAVSNAVALVAQGKWGAIGMSRKKTLMHKDLTYSVRRCSWEGVGGC